jgi:hypothetical protein
MTALDRIDRELLAIAEYERGLEDGGKAWMGALWKADWAAERAMVRGWVPRPARVLSASAQSTPGCARSGARGS